MKDGYTNQNSRQPCGEDVFLIKDGVLVKYAGQETEVMVPDGVTKIAAHAFDSCTAVREISCRIPYSRSNGLRLYTVCPCSTCSLGLASKRSPTDAARICRR